jgi:hypothetical protein
MATTDIKSYLDETYGDCQLESCECILSKQWYGTGCPNWKPFGYSNFDQMVENVQIIRDKVENSIRRGKKWTGT